MKIWKFYSTTMARSACLLLLFVLFGSVGSRAVRKSNQHRRSLDPTKSKLENHVVAKTVHYNFYGGEKRMLLPIDRIYTKTLMTKKLGKRHKKQRKKFEKKGKLAMMVHEKLKHTVKHEDRIRGWKNSIENAFKKDSLVSLLQAFEKPNTSQFKRTNETVKVISNEYQRENKTENPKALLHEVLANALRKQTSDEKIAADEIKLGLRKIISELKNVLKQDSVFLKNSKKARRLKKVDLEKLIADVRANQNRTRKDKSDKNNDESIELTPQQKLMVSDLNIPKELNLDEESEKQKGEQGIQMNGNGLNAMSGMNGMNGMNLMNAMNGMNPMDGMNGMNPMNGMNGMNLMNAMNGMNPMNGMNGMNPMNGMNRMNPMNEMNGMNPMNGMNGMNPMNGMNGMNPMNGMNGMNPMNGINGMNGFNVHSNSESYPNSVMFMNNLPRLRNLNSDIPDRYPNQNIMYNRFNKDQVDWPSDKKNVGFLPSRRFNDEPEEQEEPEYLHYPRHRPHYYKLYDEDEVDELRHGAPRYRDEEADDDDDEEEDRAQLGENDNADERATITGHLQIRKNGFHHNLLMQKKSLVGGNKKQPKRKSHTRTATSAKRTNKKQ